MLPCKGAAYSVLTHEAIIDLAWEPVIVPLLRQKYPGVSEKELQQAHAYAYGGAIAPDMGYFPFGNRLFSDLIHYVRNGDFIVALEEESRNVKEYAFALGMLAHYNADKYGHAIGVNPAVPMVFPRLHEKYGPVVTYEQDPLAHIRTETGFDVLQIARGNYASDAYHRFISFEVADSLLRRAFKRNYALDIDTLFTNLPRSIRTFRWGVKDIFPQMTKAAWKSKRKEIQEQHQTATARNFHYRMRRKAFIKDYGREIEHVGTGARFIAGLMRILPKVGPLKALKVVIPPPEAEKIFLQSFDTVSYHFRKDLAKLGSNAPLQNVDYDTGAPSENGEYDLADQTYFKFLTKLQEKQYAQVSPALKSHILKFYAKKGTAKTSHGDEQQQQKTEQALKELRAAKTVAE
jgi:hypothetical protein